MYICIESDSLHEDRRAGLLPDMEAEEDSMKNNPPSNGTVDSCQTVRLPQVQTVAPLSVYYGGLVLSCENLTKELLNISGTPPSLTIHIGPHKHTGLCYSLCTAPSIKVSYVL